MIRAKAPGARRLRWPNRRLPRTSGSDARQAAPTPGPEAEVSEAASIAKLDPPACTVRILGQCLLSKGREDEAEAAKASAAEPEGAAGKTDTANAKPDGGKETLPPMNSLPQPNLKGRPEKPIRNAEADGGKESFRRRTACRPRRPEKPIPRTPRPMAARKRSRPTNSLSTRRRTKPTICSSPRRMSFARSKPVSKHAAESSPSLKERAGDAARGLRYRGG